MPFPSFIVPIFSKDEYSGTGFIVNGMLVTANHVIEDKLHSYFTINDKSYPINIEKLVVLEDENDLNSSNIAHDLIIFETNIENNDLILSSKFDKERDCTYYGYSFDERNNMLVKDCVTKISIRHEIALNSKYDKLNNCFSCRCNLKPGNSGGPIFQDGIIIGMLIRNIKHYGGFVECVFIKGSYIIDAIAASNRIKNPCIKDLPQ